MCKLSENDPSKNLFAEFLKSIVEETQCKNTTTKRKTMRYPTCSVSEDTLSIEYELPGTNKDQVEVHTEDNLIIVTGIEGVYKGDSVKVAINKKYDLKTLTATMKEGLLVVSVTSSAKVSTKINIK